MVLLTYAIQIFVETRDAFDPNCFEIATESYGIKYTEIDNTLI